MVIVEAYRGGLEVDSHKPSEGSEFIPLPSLEIYPVTVTLDYTVCVWSSIAFDRYDTPVVYFDHNAYMTDSLETLEIGRAHV